MRFPGLFALVVLLGPVGLARAQPRSASSPPAKQTSAASDRELERSRLLVAAQRAHEQGQHEIALDLANRAVSIRESAALWRFVAEQHWLLGHSGAASEASERCLARVGMEPPSPNRAAVEWGCRFIQARTASPNQSSAVPVPPGAAAPDHERHAPRRLTTDGGEGRGRPRAADSPSTAAGRGHRWFELRPWSIVAVGVGVSSLLSAAVARLVANGWYGELKRRCATGCPEDRREAQARIQALDSLSTGLAVGGTVVAALGVTGIVVSGSRAPTGQGARVQLFVRF